MDPGKLYVITSPMSYIIKVDKLWQTIIESLKYATTGEMPPNAKQSGAFIHDPKVDRVE